MVEHCGVTDLTMNNSTNTEETHMNRLSVIMGALLVSGCATAQTYTSNYHFINAPVTHVVPVSQTYTVRNEHCTYQTVQRTEPGVGGAVVGAVIGAYIGNQIGGGSGRQIATAAGAASGAAVGDRAQNAPRTVQVCEPVYTTQDHVVGYNVTYRIGDQRFTQFMGYNPGNTVRVQVSVR